MMNNDTLISAFFNEADDAFMLFDKDLNFIEVNDALLKVLRFKRTDLIGKNITEISPDIKSSGRFDLYKEVMRTGKTLVIDELRPHPSLGNVCARVKAFKVADGLGVVSQNITDLMETIDELETFIYKSSHDMRTPISSILGIINVAKKEILDLESAKQYCDIVKKQTEKLDAIIHELVSTTKIRQGEKNVYLIDFAKIIDGVKKTLAHVAGFQDITFEETISVDQKFYSDKSLLISLFQNLIDNAIKYRQHNKNDSLIRITVMDENGGVKITIFDNGIGILSKSQQDVFKMFFRATNQASGSGLGLYTVKHCIKKLDGYIALESKENEGTSFIMYLPNEKKTNR